MNNHTRQLYKAFKKYCQRENIALTPSQWLASWDIFKVLEEQRMLGMGAGKTFLFKHIETFLKEPEGYANARGRNSNF